VLIVETHSHVEVDLDGQAPASLYGIQADGIETYLESYRRYGIRLCWVFGLRGFRESECVKRENDALAELARRYPDRLLPWGTVNPAWPEPAVRAEVRRIARELKLFGIKLVPICQGSPLSSPGMDALMDEAVTQGLPVFTHDGSPEYCSAVQVIGLALRHPRARIVSGHGGLRELWADFVPAARDVQNLWFCLSGPTQWGIQKLYDNIGPERLFFGSDGGLGHPAVIGAYLRRLERLRAPEEHRRMIMGENAMRFLFGSEWRRRWRDLQ